MCQLLYLLSQCSKGYLFYTKLLKKSKENLPTHYSFPRKNVECLCKRFFKAGKTDYGQGMEFSLALSYSVAIFIHEEILPYQITMDR